MATPISRPVELEGPHVAFSGAPADLRRYRPAAIAGIVLPALVLWAVSILELRVGAFPFAFLRYVVAAYVLLTAGLAWIVAYGIGWMLRRGEGARQVAVRTAMTALWLAPAAIFLRDRSEWALLAVGVLVISINRLLASLNISGEIPRVEGPRVLFGPIEASIRSAELAPVLVGVLVIEGAFAAALAARPLWAALLVAVGAWLCVRRYNQHSTPDLSRKPRPALRMTLASALMVLALLPHLLLPVVGRGGFVPAGGREWSLIGAIKLLLGLGSGGTGVPIGPGESAGTNRGTGNSIPKLEGTPSPGVVLFPDSVPRITTLVAPPPSFSSGTALFGAKHTKPLTILFSGVYWIMRRPDQPPPETSLILRGNPARQGFWSNDYRPLWMEAHQTLNTKIHLDCCNAVRVELTDGDYSSSQVKLELVLSNVQQGTKQSLGIQQVTTDLVQPRPQRRVLTFAVPRTTQLQTFDRITVHFWLGFRHSSRSPKISLDQFVLVPRGR